MLIDANLPPVSLDRIPEIARAAEALGFDAIWTSETVHDPFLPGALIAEHTRRLSFGTAIAVAFARSPATLAYTTWDLAAASGGRFILGLGTQVKAHIERRFGMPWPESPVALLREQIQAVRAFWRSWQGGEPLNFRGDHYRLTLMTPFFNPGPIEHPDVPVYIAGVNIGLARLAGECANGFHAHPFHSAGYLQQVILPAIEAGCQRSGRSRGEVKVYVTVFTAGTEAEIEFARQQIAFYASTPSYRAVMAFHGWETAAESLSGLAARGRWAEMPALIRDEMLETFAILTPAGELPARIIDRYQGIADRIGVYIPFLPGERDAWWSSLLDGLRLPIGEWDADSR